MDVRRIHSLYLWERERPRRRAPLRPVPAGSADPLMPTGGAPSYNDSASATQNLTSNRQYNGLSQHNDKARTGAALHEDASRASEDTFDARSQWWCGGHTVSLFPTKSFQAFS